MGNVAACCTSLDGGAPQPWPGIAELRQRRARKQAVRWDTYRQPGRKLRDASRSTWRGRTWGGAGAGAGSLEVTIALEDGRTETLAIGDSDAPRTVAEAFALRNQLDEHQTQRVSDFIGEQLGLRSGHVAHNPSSQAPATPSLVRHAAAGGRGGTRTHTSRTPQAEAHSRDPTEQSPVSPLALRPARVDSDPVEEEESSRVSGGASWVAVPRARRWSHSSC